MWRLLLLGLVALCGASVKPEDKMDGIVDLTSGNWEEHMASSKHYFVEFYAPWCGWCKKISNEWAELGKEFLNHEEIAIGKIDASQSTAAAIKAKYEVRGFPTLLLLKAGSRTPAIRFQGDRTVAGFRAFLKEHTGADSASAPTTAQETPAVPEEQKEAPQEAHKGAIELTAENFDSVVLDQSKDVFVKFYAPWCGHCSHMAPAWESLGAQEQNVVIASIDAAKYTDIGSRFGVRGFPTLKFFSKSDKSGNIMHKGARDVASLQTFVDSSKSQ